MDDTTLVRVSKSRRDRYEEGYYCARSRKLPFAGRILNIVGQGPAIYKIHDQRGGDISCCRRLYEREIVVLHNVGMIEGSNCQRVLLKARHKVGVDLRLSVEKFDRD